MIDLIRIREGCGESEYDWFTTAEPKETNKKILENFFGELDEESNDGSNEKWLTDSWESNVWVYSRQPITKEEEATLYKLGVI